MSATISTRPKPSASSARTVSSSPWVDYDVASDGRFLGIVPEVMANQQPLTVLLNWMPLR
jgi:hypothetical protein